MKKIVFTLTCLFFLNIVFSQQHVEYSKNELIVKFKQGSKVDFKNCIIKQKFNIETLDALNKKFNVKKIRLTGNRKKADSYILKFKKNQDIYNLIELYLKTDLFDFVEPNFIGKGSGQEGCLETIPDDTYFARQWGLHNDGSFSISPSTVDADIDMNLAWDVEQGDPSIIVAILDSGVKLNHPEFSGRIWQNTNESNNGTDDDNNGYVDDTNGWDFANDDNNPTDDFGHGTNVTGIIGANGNNTNGYSGVDWNCKLMIFKVLDDQNLGYYSWWSEAIYSAVDHGANVINMSLGGSAYSNSLKLAIDYAYDNGVTIIVSMMNLDNNDSYYPAAFQNTIAVGSTDPNDKRSSPFFWNTNSGSNYGNHIDVVAPGNYIYGLNYQSNTNYNSYWGGTSQAAPLVAGLSALLLAQDPNRTPDDIRYLIRTTAEDQVGDAIEDTAGFDVYYGYGRINAYQALIESTTGTNEANFGNLDFSIYPNPASEYIFIKNNIDNKVISITNILGTEILRKESLTDSPVMKINVSNFTKGIYIIHISDKNSEVIVSKKLILE